MSYNEAMQAAGAEVLLYEYFGSCQGDWWAKVRYNDVTGWVNGSYGSCSGCDAFQAEFGYSDGHYHTKDGEPTDDYVEGGEYVTAGDANANSSCPRCAVNYAKLADFGREYLDNILTQAKAIEVASENLEWDMDAKAMVDFIKQHEAL